MFHQAVKPLPFANYFIDFWMWNLGEIYEVFGGGSLMLSSIWCKVSLAYRRIHSLSAFFIKLLSGSMARLSPIFPNAMMAAEQTDLSESSIADEIRASTALESLISPKATAVAQRMSGSWSFKKEISDSMAVGFRRWPSDEIAKRRTLLFASWRASMSGWFACSSPTVPSASAAYDRISEDLDFFSLEISNWVGRYRQFWNVLIRCCINFI